MRAAIRAWLLAGVLVPSVLVLATAAAILGPMVTPSRHTAAGAPSSPASAAPAPHLSPQLSSNLVIDSTISPAGGPPLTVTVSIMTDPPVPQDVLEGTRGYLTHLVESMVESPPKGWTPDSKGRAVLKRAIEEAVPASLAPSLPDGTRVKVSAEVTPSPAVPAPAAPSP